MELENFESFVNTDFMVNPLELSSLEISGLWSCIIVYCICERQRYQYCLANLQV